MKTKLLLLLALALCGCENRNASPPVEIGHLHGWNSIKQTTIEGCQYLIYDRSLTHKGNCTNSIHRHE